MLSRWVVGVKPDIQTWKINDEILEKNKLEFNRSKTNTKSINGIIYHFRKCSKFNRLKTKSEVQCISRLEMAFPKNGFGAEKKTGAKGFQCFSVHKWKNCHSISPDILTNALHIISMCNSPCAFDKSWYVDASWLLHPAASRLHWPSCRPSGTEKKRHINELT